MSTNNRKITVTIAVPQFPQDRTPNHGFILWSSDQNFCDYQYSTDCAEMAFTKVPRECGVYRCTVECVPRAEHGEFGTILSEWLEYQIIIAEKILMPDKTTDSARELAIQAARNHEEE